MIAYSTLVRCKQNQLRVGETEQPKQNGPIMQRKISSYFNGCSKDQHFYSMKLSEIVYLIPGGYFAEGFIEYECQARILLSVSLQFNLCFVLSRYIG